MSERTPVETRIEDLEQQLLAARFEQAGRPADVGGVLEDVDGNRPVLTKDADFYFERQRNKYEQDTMPESYEAMSITQTAKALAKAEFEGDTTKIEDLSDVLADKLAAEEDKYHSTRDAEHSNDRSDNLWDRVMGVKDEELSRLKGDVVGSEQLSEQNSDNVDKPKEIESEAAQPSEPKNEVVDTPKQAEEAKRLRESAEKGDIVRFRNKDGKLEEWEVRHIGNADKHGDKGVLLRKTDGSGDEQVRMYDYMLDDLEEGPVEARNNKKSSKDVEMELYQTTDPDEARKYWEENQEKLGSSLEAYMAHGHEGSWLVERPVEKKTPVEPIPTKPTLPTKPTKPAKTPVEPIPTKPTLPTKPTANGGDTQPIPVVQVPQERAPRPERKTRGGRVWRKFGALALAGAALLGIGSGYAAGRGHENYIIKSHDTPELDANNKFADNIRDESEEVQSGIANNWGTAQEFFGEDGIATKEGQANFAAMEDAVKEEAAKIKAKHGDSITDKRAREVAEAKVKAQLAALEAAEAEKDATS